MSQTAPPETWRQKLASQLWKVKLADQALQVSKDQGRQRIVERLIRKSQDGTLGRPTTEPGDQADDVIKIDCPEMHYHQPPQRGLSTLGKAALVGLAASGIGLPIGAGLALPHVLSALRRPAVTQTEKPADTDTWMEIRLGGPEEQ